MIKSVLFVRLSLVNHAYLIPFPAHRQTRNPACKHSQHMHHCCVATVHFGLKILCSNLAVTAMQPVKARKTNTRCHVSACLPACLVACLPACLSVD